MICACCRVPRRGCRTIARARALRRGPSPGGNWCRHDRKKPRIDLTRQIPDDLPPVLVDAADRAALWTNRQRHLFSELSDHDRTERLERLGLLMKALMVRTDLVTRRAGKFFSATRFVGVTEAELAAETGMKLGRLKRAMADARDFNWITVHQQYITNEKTKAKYGTAAIRCVLPRFIRMLQINLSWDAAAKRARAKRAAQCLAPRKPPTPAPPPTDVRSLRAMRRIERAQARRQRPPVETFDDENRQRQCREVQIALRRKHPEWDTDRVRREAYAQVERTL